jgi:hypothetical protein
VGELKQQAVAVEIGRPARGAAALLQRRMRHLDLDQREAVTEALTQVDPSSLRGLIALLDDPEGWR